MNKQFPRVPFQRTPRLKCTTAFKVDLAKLATIDAKIIEFHNCGMGTAFLVFDREIKFSYHTGDYLMVTVIGDWTDRLVQDCTTMYGVLDFIQPPVVKPKRKYGKRTAKV